MNPVLLTETFPPATRARLLSDCDWIIRNKQTQPNAEFGRDISNHGRLYIYAEHLLPLVRQVFNDDSILPSYNCWARYIGTDCNLPKHKDKNACTFTVDYCVRQHEPWALYVEGEEYLLQENQSLMFMGEDQEHWRSRFRPGNMVEMIFFHYVRPDHWYFE